MSYNALKISPSLAMSSPTASGPTPESNARNIAALTSAVDMLVSQFIRPATQQANANRETGVVQLKVTLSIDHQSLRV